MLQCPFRSRIKQSADKLVHFICMISNDKVILHRIFLVTTHGVQANGHKFIVAMTIQLLWRFNEQDRQSRFVSRHICWYRYKKGAPPKCQNQDQKYFIAIPNIPRWINQTKDNLVLFLWFVWPWTFHRWPVQHMVCFTSNGCHLCSVHNTVMNTHYLYYNEPILTCYFHMVCIIIIDSPAIGM